MSARKPADRRVDSSKTRDLVVLSGGAGEPPALPTVVGPRLLKQTREWWEAVWSSQVAGSWEASDHPMVARLAKLHDDRERAWRSYRDTPLVDGSQGQPVLNPLRSVVDRCDQEIRQLEDRLGLSPMARHKLGITYGEMHRSLDSLADPLADEDDDDPRAEEDPRASSG